MDYAEFLLTKHCRHTASGFKPGRLPRQLFGWQRAVARWCVELGRAAIFAGCGLGKTFLQLAWADQVVRHTKRPVLVLTPLAVAPQTVEEGAKLGIEARQVGDQAEVGSSGIYVTNYQKLLAGRFDASAFSGVVLDESSILKAYMGKTKRLLIDSFAQTPYRLCCTATPAPNDYNELGNHSQFLGVMDSSEMLGRWFQADQSRVGHYYIKAHAERDFWEWVASWAVCLDRPSDLGYPDDGYDLPELRYHQHVVSVDAQSGAGDGKFWRDDRLTATTLHKEMRLTAGARAERVAELTRDNPGQWVVWCNTDYEADELCARIPDAVEVRGSMPDHKKEATLTAFTAGTVRVLVTKPSIAGFGLNWQHCCQTAFVGLSYSHEQFYQALRRLWRFGQQRPVEAHIVVAETEGEILSTVQRKEAEYLKMRQALVEVCRRQALARREGKVLRQVEHRVEQGESWTLHLGDSCEVLKRVPDDSVHFQVYSPPFSNLYVYSDSEADLGNSSDDEEFLRHFGYMAPELLRVTVPGRLCAVHCKDLPRYAGRDGIAGLKDFPGRLIELYERHGWSYHSRVTIWKCPVTERERTNNNGLLHKTVTRDRSQIRQGMADYLLVFRKPPRDGDGLMSAEPIPTPAGLDRWVGDEQYDPRGELVHPSPYARESKLRCNVDGTVHQASQSILLWQRYAEPVWWDIDQMDVLDSDGARAAGDEKHICPLQLGVIRRSLYLWSQPGETVLSPFAGIGSEGVVSVEEGRRFVGIELKESYWVRAIRHLKAAEVRAGQRGLFDGMEVS